MRSSLNEDLQKEYQSLYENRIPEEAPFYLLLHRRSIHPMHPKGRALSASALKLLITSVRIGIGELRMQLSQRPHQQGICLHSRSGETDRGQSRDHPEDD